MISDYINKCYRENTNIRIIDNVDTGNNYCYLYCSSNGLYRKDDPEDFQKKVIEGDRYEWENLKAELVPAREIYIRDIWLSWYVRGINAEISDYEKLIDYLADITKGYRLRCVGVSSGGFIANIIATELKAEICYSFSCQFSLRNHNDHLEKNPLLREYLETKGDHYLEYYRQIRKSDVRILYIYPDESEQDIIQHEFIKDCDNVISFAIHRESHGICIGYYALPKFISMNYEECLGLRNLHYRNLWTLKICGIKTMIKLISNKFKSLRQ